MDPQRTRYLIRVLLDAGVDIGGRDDAAMDLYESDDPQAREALLVVASDVLTPCMVLASAGESLGQIAMRTGLFLSGQERAGLVGDARHGYDAASGSVPDGHGVR
ncbi:hypothetical protein [Streptomyces sp. NPDC059247]|uniref:hypothetical protein n=1 Tax=Streptomyces sp. NPDC059247 TaxID=3346790 RepID=UPI0036C7F242